jgi:hypothetical protein
MTWYQTVELICLLLVTGAVTSCLFQVVKKWTPRNSLLRMILAWILALLIALATSWLEGDVLKFLGSWSAGTMTAADLLAYGSVIWGVATGVGSVPRRGVRTIVNS